MAPAYYLTIVTLLMISTVSAAKRPKVPKVQNNDGPNSEKSKTSSRRSTCPTNQASTSYSGNTYCCPGQFYNTAASAYCSITCSTSAPTSTGTAAPACVSMVMVTDGQYKAKVAAATGGSRVAAPAMATPGPLLSGLVAAGGLLLAV